MKKAPARRRRRRKKKTKWQQVRYFLQKKWVQFAISMSVLTFWLRLNADDFDRTEAKTIGFQAVSVIVLALLGKR